MDRTSSSRAPGLLTQHIRVIGRRQNEVMNRVKEPVAEAIKRYPSQTENTCFCGKLAAEPAFLCIGIASSETTTKYHRNVSVIHRAARAWAVPVNPSNEPQDVPNPSSHVRGCHGRSRFNAPHHAHKTIG